jgi:outer membrane lipoprotein-sorting protein
MQRWTMRTPAARSVSKFSIWLPISMLLIAPCALAQSDGALEHILKQMDEAAARFRTTQASFTWTQYNKVVDEVTDTQKGKIYFRRSGKETQMAADITQPNAKQVIFSGGRIQIYQPRIDQVDVYDAGTHREEFESFLVLGFGSSGHDMLKAFEVQYIGDEKIDGVETAKLDLTPKSEKVKQNFARILLWIDPQRGLSVQQQLFEPNGDNRLAKYFDIQVNQKISDNVFKLKTSAKTKISTH